VVSDSAMGNQSESEIGMRRVRLLRVPVSLFLRARDHYDDLARELTLIRIRRQTENDDARPLPVALAALVDNAAHRHSSHVQPAGDHENAIKGGEPIIDLTYEATATMVADLTALEKLLDEADICCRREQLLTLPRESDVVEFDHWFSGEFRRQFGGSAPRSWNGPTP
jgi:hypothetical protein